MKSLTTKKYIFIGAVAILLALTLFLPLSTVRAEGTELTARLLNLNGSTVYKVFDSPYDLEFEGEKLAILTKGGSFFYENGAVSEADYVGEEIAFVEGVGVVYLEDGKIHYGDEVLEASDEIGYTTISAYGSTLYALSGKTIYMFAHVDGEVEAPVVYETSPLEVELIAAGEDGCAYVALAADGYTNKLFFGSKPVASLESAVIDIDCGDKLYVLTPSGIAAYSDSFHREEFRLFNAERLCVGDRIYVLTRTGSIIAVSPDFSSSETLVAAGADLDWFYSSPAGTDTRLGKIYIADESLDRVAVIDNDRITYLTGLTAPVAVAADNTGLVYVAHFGKRIACFKDGEFVEDFELDEEIVDIEVDYNNEVFALTASGRVLDRDGSELVANVKGFEFQGGWHYRTGEFIDDVQASGSDFAVDVAGNIFCVDGNVITAIVGGEKVAYTVKNAVRIRTISISKVGGERGKLRPEEGAEIPVRVVYPFLQLRQKGLISRVELL